MSGTQVPALSPDTLYCGDCLPVLQTQVPSDSVDLVYMDPPFGSGNDYEVVFNDGVEIRHFRDRWIGGKQGYLNWIEPRIRESLRVLKPTGAFCLHCDDHLNAYLRVLCDTVFGEGNFRNEIIWKRTHAHGDPKRFGRVHDTLLLYSKGQNWTWNPQFTKYSEEYLRSSYKFAETKDGKIVDWDWSRELPEGWRVLGSWPMDSPHPRPNLTYVYKGFEPPANGWRVDLERMKELDSKGLLWFPDGPGGRIRRKGYLDEQRGSLLQDVWTDIPPVQSRAAVRQGFPTQKPLPLLERIIGAVSPAGGVVLDPVCGCGTSLLAAKKLGLHWIGIDISPTACRLVAKRLGYATNSIVGLPRSLANVREMMKLDPTGIEFQNWVCDLLGAVSTTKRGSAPRPDGGIDGWVLSMIPISVKGSDAIGRPVVDQFETNIRKQRKNEGYIVAFSFSKNAYEEAVRASREDKITVDLLEVREKTIPTNGGNPDVRTYLYSELTKRTWGEPSEAGPRAPPPLMLPTTIAKKGRTKRLSESIPTPPEAGHPESE